jgi:hypothetical protein
VEIEDEEDLMSKVKYNDPEEPEDSEGNTDGNDNTGDNTNEEPSKEEDSGEFSDSDDSGETNTAGEQTGQENTTDSNEDSEETSSASSAANSEDSEDATETADSTDDINEVGEESETADDTEATDESPNTSDEETQEENETEDSEFPDEEDWLDDDAKAATKEGDANKKTEARKIKRERTLNAAKEALAKAQANKAPKVLISELENAIAALEELVEAVSKNIADLSDEEFNLRINRVLDAIDALGTSDLAYSTEEERQAKVQEIKADMADSKTQAELSAEDAAVIRAETQAIKARDAEADKYKKKARGSFQGFQAFMDSLQRGIALQVSYEEERDDTWSALSRRNSGAGVLKQGQKINELPNKKIPIIDFYFDQSGSWDERDLAIGNQAVEALAKMEEDGKIKVNIYYFSNHVHANAADARAEGGTRAWNDIIKNLVVTGATNVVVMTDSDMEDWWEGDKALKHTVSGFVWYLWRRGDNAPRLPRDLQGRGGTMQYSC